MSSESRELALLSRAQQALAAARTIDEIKDVRDLADVARGYARRKKFAQEVLLDVACLTIRAEHALGTALRQMELAKAAPGNQYAGLDRFHAGTGPKLLKDLGISKQASHRAQLIASLPKEELERWLADQCAAGKEPTLAAARRHAEESAGQKNGHSQSRKRGPPPLVSTDEVTEVLEHQKMLDQLLSRIYDGGTAEFERAEGRMVRRLIRESIELLQELAKVRWIG